MIAGLAVTLIVANRAVSSLKEENLALRQAAALQAHSSAPGNNPQSDETVERLRAEAAEVHKLRNEVRQLRHEKEAWEASAAAAAAAAAAQPLSAATASLPVPAATQGPKTNLEFVAKESWTPNSYATAESALQSALAALREGDVSAFFDSVTPEEKERWQKEWGSKTPEQMAQTARKAVDKVQGYTVLETTIRSPDEVVLTIFPQGGDDKVERLLMRRFGQEWKLAGKPK